MSEENKIKAAQMLIDKGIDINFPNVILHTPLLEAFLQAEFKLANFLIDKGAFVYILDQSETPTEQ